MKTNEVILILGATSCIAEHVTRIWAKTSPQKIILIARDQEKLLSISSNIKILNTNVEIISRNLKFENLNDAQDLLDEVFAKDIITKALISFGNLPDQTGCQNNIIAAENALHLNGVLSVIYSEMLIKKMQNIKYSQLAVIGSVAGDRGRKSNYFYGAAKSMLATFVEGAQHRLKFCGSPLKLSIIKPGPTITPMTESLDLSIGLADPKEVAMNIVRGLSKKKPIIYAPSKWKLIMLIIRNLPSFIFNRLDL